MYDSRRDILDALAAAPDAFAVLVAGVDEELARAATGGDEGWSLVEVACHLRDAEAFTLARVLAMRDEEEPVLPGYDQDALAAERDYAGGSMAVALASFMAQRAELVAALRGLDDAGWARRGLHEEAGPITIEGLLAHIVSHDIQHIGQMARALRDARAR